MIFTGTAGQLEPSIQMGEIVCPSSWVLSTGEEYEVARGVADRLRARGVEVSGRGLTVLRPVLRARSRVRCFKDTGARICDMEAAGALKIASLCGVPCIAPKVVSDTGDASFLAFWAHFDRNMTRLGEYLRAILPIVAASD
jgi:nucleoside phosphorylase